MTATTGAAAVRRARALIGVPFRPQGRSGTAGLDCVGLAALAFGLPLSGVRRDYALRGGTCGEAEHGLETFFVRIASDDAGEGDLLLVRPGAAQLHMLILSDAGYIHADAGLRRVTEVPGAVPWPIRSAWRVRAGP
jgi:lipoprotein Spr